MAPNNLSSVAAAYCAAEWGLLVMKIGDRVFVYGTLRPGQHNHKWAMGAVHVGTAIAPGFLMHHLGGFPAVIKHKDYEVHGDLLEITDEQQVASMDRLEGHPNFYRREEVFTSQGQAWIYVFADERSIKHAPRIEHGDWLKVS